jgi:hypothetical protein
MRPKHVLWLAAAVVCLAWFVLDPQARIGGTDMQGAHPTPPAASDLQAAAATDRGERFSAGL